MFNWKTTLAGIITATTGSAALIAASPAMCEWLNPSIAHRVVAFCTMVAALSHIWGQLNAADAKSNNIPSKLPLILALFIPAYFLGCATNTGDATKDRNGRVTNAILQVAGRDAVNIALTAIANQAATGFTGDWASSAEQGLWSNMGNIVNSSDCKKVLDAWSPNTPVTNIQLAGVIDSTAPTTIGQIQTTVATIATSIEAARNIVATSQATTQTASTDGK
jgi:hypothetical protein